MSSFLDGLRHAVVVADGGWASILAQRGWPLASQPAELANLALREMVLQLAQEYVDAGAMLLTTNTFSTNADSFARRATDADARALAREGVRIAREAVGDRETLVTASIGPTGKFLAVGEVEEDDLRGQMAAHVAVLAEAGAGAIVFETFSDLRELVLCVEAARTACRLPVIACMSFDSGPQRTQTAMGVAADEAAAALEGAGADVIGCNCCTSAATVLGAVVALRANCTRPLWVKPSVGAPDLVDDQIRYAQTPEEFVAPFAELIDAGANIVGGCCGAGPEHIALLAKRVHSRQLRRKPAGEVG